MVANNVGKDPDSPEPIAIVGSACRFPGGASSPSKLWDLLKAPRDLLKEIPHSRFNSAAFYHPNGSHHGTTNVQHSYMLHEDLRHFDAQFFNIKPKEAESIDPQQRFLMETVYEALESGGHTIDGLRGSDTGVYVGVMAVDYLDVLTRDVSTIPTYYATGIARSIISNRISYFFDWHGPSMTIDTACSSSMVAVHQAVQSLRSNESKVAVAAGAEIILGPENYIGESKMNLLSPTGRSRMWDSDADGYARGDGVAVAILKRLSDALADGDHIECVIRETGLNQDGRGTGGLTVPSTEAQAQLIQRTYEKAGLNILDPKDRPQFFEAHGTGTKVGDPREAAAIKEAFFPVGKQDLDVLYVGSIKTVIGHTEGTAGLAGIIKGSLAVQHGIIPQNLLFTRLNPELEPYYDCLRIPLEQKQWPPLPPGAPRRVSVNSFGFGGTNGHAILESYPQIKQLKKRSGSRTPTFTPFVFSAATEKSLTLTLREYVSYLKSNPEVDLRDLAWTLQSRRTILSTRAAFHATTTENLISKIEKGLEEVENDTEKSIGTKSMSPGQPPRILGIFTGQGAQWATMGSHLITSSDFVRERVKKLEKSLAELPDNDRPTWSLKEELLADAAVSRIGEAAFSQPLCTAVQVLLVDLLKSAGLKFAAVVGHSSGEIAAAYAAGFISANDAIRIAYYRGFHGILAHGSDGQKGAMLAVGTSREDAQELCELPAFEGRLTVAADNAPASVTLSGDADAIEEAKVIFDDEKVFARRLKVEIAYHSHHMFPCSEPYAKSLGALNIKIPEHRSSSCQWYSTVLPGKAMEYDVILKNSYWVDNMVNPVHFKDALTIATQSDVNIVLEVGPHPALKGPASQTIFETRGASLPYLSSLARGNNDIEALSNCLGSFWTTFDTSGLDFEAFERSVTRSPQRTLLSGLPSYMWDHSRLYWHESRRSRTFRTKPEPFNQVLGIKSPDSTDWDMRWTNQLKPSDIPWLSGHKLQGQTVFPAAGYVVMALESARSLVKGRSVKLFEVHDIVVRRAITFEDDADFSVETIVTLTDIKAIREPGQDIDEASFTCYAEIGEMELMAKARISVQYGDSSFSTLPNVQQDPSRMTSIDEGHFYDSLSELGYGYTGSFRSMSQMKRKMDHSAALLSTYVYEEDEREPLLVHPTMLDVAFHAAFLAQSSPGDNRLWALHVPTSIRCVRVNPSCCEFLPHSQTKLPVYATLRDAKSVAILGDVDIHTSEGKHVLLQIEDLLLVPFSPANPSDDRVLFSYNHWDVDAPNGALVMGDDRPSEKEVDLAGICERLSYYYLRKWKANISIKEWELGEWHHRRLRDTMEHLLSTIDKGKHPTVKKEWSNDTDAKIKELSSKYPDSLDVKLISAVGESMPAVVRGKSVIIEHMMKDNVLDDFYKKGLGLEKYNAYLAKMVKQIVHRYPHLNILEIGKCWYRRCDSEWFMDKAAVAFNEFSHKMSFKTLDIEELPVLQGYQEYSYDLIIASNVLHATKSLHNTLTNVRTLLKPGGYLLLLEITDSDQIRIGTMTSGLAGWWVGANDNRQYTPTVSPSVWNNVLRNSGFSGVDTKTPDRSSLVWPFSVMASQAVDDRISVLRRPLSPSAILKNIEELVILGSKTITTSKLAEDLNDILSRYVTNITILEGLPSDSDDIPPMSTFINLVDLDEPIFKNMTTETMRGLKSLFDRSRNLLWITQGCIDSEPYHNASVGLGRAILHEAPHIRLQFLDLDNLENPNVSRVIAEMLLRLHTTSKWEEQDILQDGILWSQEPELILQKNQILLPRVLRHSKQNARLNSLRRQGTQFVDHRNSAVEIISTNNSVYLKDYHHQSSRKTDGVIFHITHAGISSIKLGPQTFLFVSVGFEQKSGNRVAILSETNSSIQTQPVASVPVNCSYDQCVNLLSTLLHELLVNSLLHAIPNNSMLLVYELSVVLASRISQKANARHISVRFGTAETDCIVPGWIRLSPQSPRRLLQAQFPRGLTHFIDLSALTGKRGSGSQILASLPLGCKFVDSSSLAQEMSIRHPSPGIDFPQILEAAVREAQKSQLDCTDGCIDAGDLADSTIHASPLTILDWTAVSKVRVRVQHLDTNSLFSRHKTYLLAGLSGEIGQSLCEWMARNGAGGVCLTSRHPKVDIEWVRSIERLGTIVQVVAMDLTVKEDVQKVCDDIERTMPPIGGVANGAMILHDTLFSQMSFEMMKEVLDPKINGTNYLDEIFSHTDLEFFILFSSLSSVVGNTGQSNYAAAFGLGYVERAGQVVQDQLTKFGYMPISESDFHQIFAEAIVAGRPESEENPEIVTGIRPVSSDEEARVPWFDNPRFSHCIVEANETNTSTSGDRKKNTSSAIDQLAVATSLQQVFDIITRSFAVFMQQVLRLSGDIGYETPLVQLGVDSLLAVEIRSWLFKELKTDLPVLKIMAGGSVNTLCQQILEKLPEKLIPKVRRDNDWSQTPTESTNRGLDSSSTEINGSNTTTTPVLAMGATTPRSEASALDDIPSDKEISSPPTPMRIEPISFAQSRFWFLHLLLDDQTAFNVAFYYRVSGNVRISDLDRALRMVGQRHEALRTGFIAENKLNDTAYQGILASSALHLEQRKVDSFEEVLAEYKTLRSHIFDLKSGCLMRVILLSLSQTLHYLLFSYHHAIMDGVSYQIFLSDLEKAYNGKSLGSIPRQFSEFSNIQLQEYKSGEWSGDLKYWKEVFRDPPQPMDLLPISKTTCRVPMKTFEVNQVKYRLGSELTTQIKKLSSSKGSTTFHFHLACFKTMLFRLMEEPKDLTIGIADANRTDSNSMNTIGLFLNLLALRFQYDPTERFGDAIVEARDRAYAALEHSRIPFDVLLQELVIPRSAERSPIFQAFFDYRQGAREKQQFGNLQIEVEDVHPGRTAYDITLDVTESSGETLIMVRTQKSLYEPAETELLIKTYVNLLRQFTTGVTASVQNTTLFDKSDLKRGIEIGLDQIAQIHPDRISLKDGYGRVLTYRKMTARAEAIAEALQTKGIGFGSKVAVFEQATSDWVCSLLAIMRLGALYVPLDLRNPLKRLASILHSCGPHAVLVDNETAGDTNGLKVAQAKIVNVSLIGQAPSTSVPNKARANAAGAILYTSGSTGMPKGVIIKHSSLRNEIEGYTKTWKLGAENVIQQSAFTFNHSSDQIWTGLVNGGSVYVVPWNKRGDPIEITRLIREQQITYTKATPSEYLQWLEYGLENLQGVTDWQYAFGGGESLTKTVVAKFSALNIPHLRLFNSYGPAEITISSTKMEVPYQEHMQNDYRIPCGYSLPNYAAYILDHQLRPLPPGVPGEIYLGGAGVSLGYLSNEDLTDQLFIHNPYAPAEYVEQGWTTMYRTGDIGHLRKDGALVFHCRIADDTQVKIRGIRIELGDIEKNIVQASGGVLQEAVVSLHDSDTGGFLVAHVVFSPQHQIFDSEEYLRQLLIRLPLPQYMIPVMMIPLNCLPLTNHSKVDRRAIKALPLPQREGKEDDGVILNGISSQLKIIWEDVLHNKDFGFNITSGASFFEVGGNSLLIVRLQSRIREKFNVAIPLVELLDANTLGDMTKKLEEGLHVQQIDWDSEIQLPKALGNNVGTQVSGQKSDKKVILITGSTGYLAKYILQQLVENDSVVRVYCVAIRGEGGPSRLTVSSDKIIGYSGDLSQTRLGLSENNFLELSQEVDVILHMGAIHTFWDNYHVLYPTNVASTKQLIQLAAPRRIPIHYISSAGVVPTNKSIYETASVAAYSPPTDGSEGYVASRWASERLLEEASARLNIPSSIHRFIPGRKINAATEVLEEYSRLILKLNLVPDVSGWKGHFDVMQAGNAADAIVKAVLFKGSNDERRGSSTARFSHHECDYRLEVATLKEFIEDRFKGHSMTMMPVLRWVYHAKQSGFGYLFASQDITLENRRGENGRVEALDSRR
ncbi:hypothetical protein UA08_00474 [Talaromyces atroroseus]|uniref:Carrier domain-containing protein n=1 Tax=Talaromyces atroroseus TaxID=1441469 RepID=A0A225AQN0_TALAT|nr:hypothetical protein UA08_00474 [Talaromyces atroroseus]OKL63922.1 hypothetical protein UA08_00474 [Talaromyces atroroseus]